MEQSRGQLAGALPDHPRRGDWPPIDLARDEKLDYIDIEELVNHSRIKELYADRIERMNRELPSYETIKYFGIVPVDFSIEGGELTPTLKMKRKIIYEKYKQLVDDLYLTSGNGVIKPQNKNNGGKI